MLTGVVLVRHYITKKVNLYQAKQTFFSDFLIFAAEVNIFNANGNLINRPPR